MSMSERAVPYRARPQETIGHTVLTQPYALTQSVVEVLCDDLEPFAADTDAVRSLEQRWAHEGIQLPPDIECQRAEESASVRAELSVIEWTAHYADNQQLYDVFAWNAAVTSAQARDEQWYDGLQLTLRDIRLAVHQAAASRRQSAYDACSQMMNDQADGTTCVIGEPLDLLLPTAYAYNDNGTKVFRRHYDVGVVTHEHVHDWGGFMNPALSEGTTQYITRRILAFNNLDRRYTPLRKAWAMAARQGVEPPCSLDLLPEHAYSLPQSGIEAVSRLLTGRYGTRQALIEQAFVGEDRLQNHAQFRQLVLDATQADLIGFCDKTYADMLAKCQHDGTHNGRIAAARASDAVAHALLGASAILENRVGLFLPTRWQPVLHFLRQQGAVARITYN